MDEEVTTFDIALVGDGATPETTPVDVLVGLAHAYFVALRKVAEQNEIDLGPLVGAQIIPGSAKLRTIKAAADRTRAARGLLHRSMQTPGAADADHLRNLATAARRLPPGWRALALVGNESEDEAEAVIPTTAARRDWFTEVTTRRLTVVGLDVTPTKIKVYDRRHDREYWLRCEPAVLGESAEAIARSVDAKRPVVADVKAELERDQGSGKITGGRVIKLEIVDEDWSVEGLLSWFGSTFRGDPA